MSYTPNDLKAIKWFFAQNPQFRPQMGYYPIVHYTDEKGELQKKPVSVIRHSWDKQRKKKK